MKGRFCKCCSRPNKRAKANWRRSDPAPKGVWVYCRVCQQRWITTGKYAKDLKPVRKRMHGRLTDADILQLINDKMIYVCEGTATVYSRTSGDWVVLKTRKPREQYNYEAVRITHQTKRKTIFIHRLMWIWCHRELIPPGYDVDHIDGTDMAYPHVLSNLRLRESSCNRSRRPYVDQNQVGEFSEACESGNPF
jgi:hypothetical protein